MIPFDKNQDTLGIPNANPSVLDDLPESSGLPSKPMGLQMRKDIRFVPQNRVDNWTCVIEDPVAKKFYQVGRLEYLVASALDGNHDVASIQRLISQVHPSEHFDTNSVEATMKWLVNLGLATFPAVNKPTRPAIEPRSSDLEQAEPSTSAPSPSAPSQNPNAPTASRKSPGFNLPVDPFSLRFPLTDGAFIEKIARCIQFLCSAAGIVAGVLLMLVAAMTFTANASYFTELGTKLFVPEAALWWAGAWLLLKIFHELGHATFCVSEGARIRGAGIAFFYLAPMPYVDTTDTWRLPTRKSRVLCAAGGMWFELLLACLALVLCRWFENQTMQYFCVALATLGTFTTVAFNANPLVRFDGYYILSDLLDRPRLWTEAQSAWKSLFNGRSLFISTAISLHGLPLVLYGGGCFINRWIMMIGLAWGTWHAWRGIGLAIIALACYIWFIAPYIKKQSQLAATGQPAFRLPSLLRIAGVGLMIGMVAIMSYFVPSPLQPQVPGVLSYGNPCTVRPDSDGFIARVLVEDNRFLDAGTPIVEFENLNLSLTRATVALQLESSRERCLVLRAQAKIAEMQAEQAKVESLESQLAQLDTQSEQMIIKAPITGRFIARQLSRQVGQYIKAGQILGIMVPEEAVEASCSISQEDVEQYRASIGQPVFVYLQGLGRVQGRVKSVDPRGIDTLESPVLAAKFGGPIAVHYVSQDTEKKDSLRTNQPRFVATIAIDAFDSQDPISASLTAGQLCRVELIDSHLTVANTFNRWFKAFVQWIKPPQVDSQS